jgi:hypothetical protein
MVAMTMYVDILSTALGGWVEDLTGTALVDYALSCRAEALRVSPYLRDMAYSSLAAEVTYDRALIKLCEANDVPALAMNFVHPREERSRLEHHLASSGVDLADLARRRRET